MKKIAVVWCLLAGIGGGLAAQINTAGGAGTDRPLISFYGNVTGLYTLGFQDESQRFASGTSGAGLYGLPNSGTRNGYFTAVTLNTLFQPADGADVFAKFLVRSRPGSPYIPLQLADAGEKTWGFELDSAYGRLQVLRLLGIDSPAEAVIKAGYFDTAPKGFESVSAWGNDVSLAKVRTKTVYALQAGGEYALPGSQGIGLTLSTAARFNEELAELQDEDGTYDHGTAVTDKYVMPFHVSASLRSLAIPLGYVSGELVYALNGEHINSGHSFGLSARGDLKVGDALTVLAGAGFAFYEKNIDVLAGTAVGAGASGVTPYAGDSTAFRAAWRGNFSAGARTEVAGVAISGGLAFTMAGIGHLYREDIMVPGLSVDVKAVYQERYFLGAGAVLAVLSDVEWKTKDDAEAQAKDNFSHTFTLEDNTGFEVYGGLQLKKSRFVIGYNMNKGLAMNYGIESQADAQYKYNKKDALVSDGLFERGGLFVKAVFAY